MFLEHEVSSSSILPRGIQFGGHFELRARRYGNIKLHVHKSNSLWFSHAGKGMQLRFVKGLTGRNTVSFEAYGKHGWYIRHQNNALQLLKLQDKKQFKEDSSFYIEKFGGYYRFRSFNYPNYYISVHGNRLIVSIVGHSQSGYINSCFKIVHYSYGELLPNI